MKKLINFQFKHYRYLSEILFLSIFVVLSIPTLSHCYAAAKNKDVLNKIQWHPCKNNHNFLCGKISVPLDYANSQLGKIELSVSMHRAAQKSRGYLLFNFGGPWADNVNILPSITKNKLTATMIKQFDLLVLNPRGVSPNLIQCNTKEPEKLKEINQAMKRIFAQGNEHNIEALYLLAKQRQIQRKH